MKTIITILFLTIQSIAFARIENTLTTNVYANSRQDQVIVETNQKGRLFVYDTNGYLISEQLILSGKNEINFCNLQASTYHLVIRTNEETIVKKLKVK